MRRFSMASSALLLLSLLSSSLCAIDASIRSWKWKKKPPVEIQCFTSEKAQTPYFSGKTDRTNELRKTVSVSMPSQNRANDWEKRTWAIDLCTWNSTLLVSMLMLLPILVAEGVLHENKRKYREKCYPPPVGIEPGPLILSTLFNYEKPQLWMKDWSFQSAAHSISREIVMHQRTIILRLVWMLGELK